VTVAAFREEHRGRAATVWVAVEGRSACSAVPLNLGKSGMDIGTSAAPPGGVAHPGGRRWRIAASTKRSEIISRNAAARTDICGLHGHYDRVGRLLHEHATGRAAALGSRRPATGMAPTMKEAANRGSLSSRQGRGWGLRRDWGSYSTSVKTSRQANVMR